MAFNVTQCPACESTFNTNASILESAAGRVRCGACLTVFEAASNYVDESENDAQYNAHESVFVGNNPQEYFDPSQFLTRSSLTEDDEPATLESSDLEAAKQEDLIEELENASTIGKDFFSAVVDEIHNTDKPAGLEESQLSNSVDESPENEPFLDSEPDSKTLDEESPDEQSSEDQPTQEVMSEDEDADSSINEAPENTLQPPTFDLYKPLPTTQSPVGIRLSASFTMRTPAQLEEPEPEPEKDNPDEEAGESQDENTDENPDNRQTLAHEENEPSQLTDEPFNSNVTLPDATHDDPGTDFLQSVEESLIDEPLEVTDHAWTVVDSSTEEDADDETETEHSLENESTIDESAIDKETGAFDSVTEDDATAPQDSFELADSESDTEEHQSIDTPEPEEEEEEEESTETIRARALRSEFKDEEALEAIPKANLAALGTMSTPLELLQKRERHWGRRIFLSVSILGLGALLTAQYLWQRIEVYSQIEQTRPFYETACNWLSCNLPVYSDISAIRSDNLIVRSHPDFPNGLMVNITIRNTAKYPQAFPIMVLSFNSANNNIVALREFDPTEYLDPGLRSISNMPAMTPVQIDLAIIDPGPDATNYTLAFRRP